MMNKDLLIEFLTLAVGIGLVTALISHFVIPILKSRKVGQKILDIGPRWHKGKEGTPTMGGICFILAILILMSVVAVVSLVRETTADLIPLALTLGLGVANGMIGFVDDYTKLIKKQNQGLTAAQKYLCQLLVAVVYVFAMGATGHISRTVHVPFTSLTLDFTGSDLLGVVYYIFMLLLITGVVNSVNLTDGIDGLASSVTAVIGGFFAVMAFTMDNRPLALIAAALIGGTVGFLVYNFYPAKVFMGDTGSLFLGGMVVGAVFMIDQPLLIVIGGIIYILEAASVIIQVGVYKLTHKRVFKMAPIHHHFEKCDWSENTIVGVFSFITLLACVLAYFGAR